MWIEEKEQNGKKRFCYRERYYETLTGKSKIASITLNSNSSIAKKQAFELLQAKIDKKLDKAGIKENRTFESVLDEWFEQCKTTTSKPTTLRGYKSAKDNIVAVLPKGALLNAITATDIQKVLNKWYYKMNKSYSGTNQMKTVISLTLQYAKKSQYIKDISFLHDVKIKRKQITNEQKTKKENKFLTTGELQSIISELNAMKYNRLALAVEFQSLTGLRFGELCALRERDFDEINKRVNVNGTIAWSLSAKDDNYRQNTTKNIYSQRWVTLNKRCVDILYQLMKENRILALEYNAYTDLGYLFTSRTGYPIRLVDTNKVLSKLTCTNKKVTTHMFRHAHITMLCEQGLPLKAIMQRVGHHSPTITMEIYAHVTSTMEKQVVENLDNIKIS